MFLLQRSPSLYSVTPRDLQVVLVNVVCGVVVVVILSLLSYVPPLFLYILLSLFLYVIFHPLSLFVLPYFGQYGILGMLFTGR